uniref:Uncharacterized protein n=1 Tax=Cucumis melo TaxID=3656 RepID=A0A9I9DIR6_CUCME
MARFTLLVAFLATLLLSSLSSSSSFSSSSTIVSRKLLASDFPELPDFNVPPFYPEFRLPPPLTFFGPNTPSSIFPNFPFFSPPSNPSP